MLHASRHRSVPAAARCLATLAIAAGSLLASAAHAAVDTVTEVAGVKFDNSVQLGATRLQLNGAGVRYKAVFKVYAAGLYLPGPAATPEAATAPAVPSRLHIVMLREIDANELGKLFTRGMEQNAPREEFSKSIGGIMRMSDIFSAKKKLMPGESFSVDWTPGVGTVITVNGKPMGEPVREPEFHSALMSIWFGHEPADAGLKNALLGKPVAAATNGDR